MFRVVLLVVLLFVALPSPAAADEYRLAEWHDVDPAWQVSASAERWNRVAGCELFSTSDGRRQVAVRHVEDLSYGGITYWGYHRRTTSGYFQHIVELNPDYVSMQTTMHELGHVLGLPHTSGDDDLMHPRGKSAWPTDMEVERVRWRHAHRCLGQVR